MKDKLFSEYEWSDRFKFTVYNIGKLALLIHVVLILFFYMVKVPEMVGYNIISTLFFVLLMYLIRKEYNVRLIFLIASVEVVLHACLATYYIGIESNFIFLIFVLPSVFLLNPYWKTWQSYAYFLSIGVVYSLNSFYFRESPSKYQLDEQVIFYTGMVLVMIVGFMIFLVVFYYSKLVYVNDKSIREANKILYAKNEEKRLIIKEIHHRIKNNLQVVISLLRLQASKIDDKNVVEMFKSSQKRIFSMALLHESLLKEYTLELINAQEYFKRLVENLIDSYSVNKKIDVELDIENVELGMQTLTPLGLIVNEVITNSLKYAFANTNDAQITISLHKKNKQQYLLQISDNGLGIDTEKESKGLGTKLISIFVKQLNGTTEVFSDNGTHYKIVFEEIEHT